MPFTDRDRLNECILNVMLAEAWSGSDPDPEKRKTIENWIGLLNVEGPERARIRELAEEPIDDFQAEVFYNEFRGALHNGTCRGKALEVVERMHENDALSDLEKRFLKRLQKMLGDRSGIEEMIQDALAVKDSPE